MVRRAWSIMISCNKTKYLELELECTTARLQLSFHCPAQHWPAQRQGTLISEALSSVSQSNTCIIHNIGGRGGLELHWLAMTKNTLLLPADLEIGVEDHDLLRWYEEVHLGAGLGLALGCLQWESCQHRNKSNFEKLFSRLLTVNLLFGISVD